MKKTENRMFDNPFLELLSKSGPKMMITFHLIVVTCTIYIGNQLHSEATTLQIFSFFILGYFSWTITEYLMHRYVFHWESENKFLKAFHYAMHGYHHEVPHDYNRLFMPPVPAFLFLCAFFGLFYIFLGKYTWFFLPGFELGYLTYSIIHYTVHVKVPKNKYLNKLWLHHANHHYKTPDKAYGVSSVFWDKIFRTLD